MVAIVSLVISALSLVFSFYNFHENKKTKINELAKGLFSTLQYLSPRDFEEYKKMHFDVEKQRSYSVPLGVKLINKSNESYTDIFIIAVEDFKFTYNSITDVQSSITNGYYSYIEKMAESELTFIIPSGGGGMNKQSNVLLIYTDSENRKWVKLPNNKFYKVGDYMQKLFDMGVPNPGYRNRQILKLSNERIDDN